MHKTFSLVEKEQTFKVSLDGRLVIEEVIAGTPAQAALEFLLSYFPSGELVNWSRIIGAVGYRYRALFRDGVKLHAVSGSVW